MRCHNTFKLPNSLILDGSLSYSARRMGAVLFAHRNPLGACKKSLAQLASLAACSVPTARKSLLELENAGYVERCRNYRFDEDLGRKVYDRTVYHCALSFRGGFTLIPRTLFSYPELRNSSFAVALYLFFRAGCRRRAFPSLRRVCRELWMSSATLCRALRQLNATSLFLVRRCLKRDRAFSCNSYFLCANTVSGLRRSLRRFLRRLLSAPSRRTPFPWLHYTSAGGSPQALFDPGGVFIFCKQ